MDQTEDQNTDKQGGDTAPTGEDTGTTTQQQAAPPAPPEPKEDPFDRGIREANEAAGVAAPKPKDEAKPPEAAPAADGKDGKPPAADAKSKDDDKGKKPDPEPDPDIEKEIAERKLEGNSAIRFRELANDSKQLRELKPIAEQAVARAREWEDTVTSTGATPEEFGNTMALLSFMKSGDREKRRRAFDTLSNIRAELAEDLGIAVDGVDPLSKYPELAAEVEAGDISRKRALELIEAKRAQELSAAQSTRVTQQQSEQQAVQSGAAAVTALGKELEAANPAEYAAKLPALKPILQAVRNGYPPAQWAAEVKKLYDALPYTAAPAAPAAPAKPPIGSSPLRSGGVSSSNARPELTSANAWDEGMKEAHRRGYGGVPA